MIFIITLDEHCLSHRVLIQSHDDKFNFLNIQFFKIIFCIAGNRYQRNTSLNVVKHILREGRNISVCIQCYFFFKQNIVPKAFTFTKNEFKFIPDVKQWFYNEKSLFFLKNNDNDLFCIFHNSHITSLNIKIRLSWCHGR